MFVDCLYFSFNLLSINYQQLDDDVIIQIWLKHPKKFALLSTYYFSIQSSRRRHSRSFLQEKHKKEDSSITDKTSLPSD